MEVHTSFFWRFSRPPNDPEWISLSAPDRRPMDPGLLVFPTICANRQRPGRRRACSACEQQNPCTSRKWCLAVALAVLVLLRQISRPLTLTGHIGHQRNTEKEANT